MKKLKPAIQNSLRSISLILIIILIGGCQADENKIEKEVLLKADREAPLGWVYLTIYIDSTFEFTSAGLGSKKFIYTGKVDIKEDSLFFAYSDSIPKAGKTAIISHNTVAYIDGQYYERLSISLPFAKHDTK